MENGLHVDKVNFNLFCSTTSLEIMKFINTDKYDCSNIGLTDGAIENLSDNWSWSSMDSTSIVIIIIIIIIFIIAKLCAY